MTYYLICVSRLEAVVLAGIERVLLEGGACGGQKISTPLRGVFVVLAIRDTEISKEKSQCF